MEENMPLKSMSHLTTAVLFINIPNIKVHSYPPDGEERIKRDHDHSK